MTRPLLRACAALLLTLYASFPALAQDAPADKGQSAQAVKVEDARRLIDTLENDAERQKLVTQLKALAAVQQNQPKQREDGVFGAVSAGLESLGDDALDAVSALQNLPGLISWATASLSDAGTRQNWGQTVARLLLLLVSGIIADQVVNWLLRRPQKMFEPKETPSLLVRIPLGLARAVVRGLPVAAFCGGSYAGLTYLGLKGNAYSAGILLITAYASVRGLMVLARFIIAPRTPSLRLIPVNDETAEYMIIWARRLSGVGMFGGFATEAARLLGLPKGGYVFMQKALGLSMAAMLVIFILQNRAAVAGWIRGVGRAETLGGRMQAVWNRLSEVWHVLACLYVVAGYVVWAMQVKGGFEFMLRASVVTVLILGVATVLSGGLRRAIERGFSLSPDTRAHFPLLEARANRYLPVLHVVTRGAVTVVAVLAVAQAWGLDAVGLLSSGLGRRVLSSLVSISVVLVVALLLWELATSAIERYLSATDGDGRMLERSARAKTLLPLARNALFVVLVVMVSLIVLSELGVNIAPLLAGAGVVGVAVGFGSQKLVQDVITGAFILFEDTMSVGDVVSVGGHSGSVEAMSIRAIRLRDFTGAVHTIPFSAVSTVINMTKDFSFAVFEVGVAYREDTDHVIEVLRGLGDELRADPEYGAVILEPLEIVGLDRFDASSVVIKARFKTLPIKQWWVMREFNRRMKKRFDELGIEIPFPQSTVWFGEDKQGKAPVARISVQEDQAMLPASRG